MNTRTLYIVGGVVVVGLLVWWYMRRPSVPVAGPTMPGSATGVGPTGTIGSTSSGLSGAAPTSERPIAWPVTRAPGGSSYDSSGVGPAPSPAGSRAPARGTVLLPSLILRREA